MTDFDFMEEGREEEGREEEGREEIATSGNLGLTSEVVKKARTLAESPKGLDINKFFIEHQLINVSLDRLLHGPLDKDGNLI